MNEEIRTRIAPSPTGLLHVGTAHTALFNWLFARSKQGKFIMRIEDTDKERSRDEFIDDITDGLIWLGLDWDEGPERGDGYGPYLQSKRFEIYKKYAQELLDNKKAYYCYCTPEELEKERKEQSKNKQAPKYSGRCCNLTESQIAKFKAEGRKPSVRFKVESKQIKFKDLIKGIVEFDTGLFGDFVIMKSDGTPTFMFAGAIDDFLMKISHVIRGEDHLSNTPRQILLDEALNFAIPEYGHLPLILNPDRTKLSKRKNPTSLSEDFIKKGYLPEAMINFLVLMGWSAESGQEFWTLKDLINEFSFDNVGKSPSVFDQKKLDFLNGYYIRKMSIGDLAKIAADFLGKNEMVKDGNKFMVALSLVQERLKNLSEIPEQIEFFFKEPSSYKDIIVPKNGTLEKTKKALVESLKYLEEENDFGRDSLEQLLRAVATKNGFSAGVVLWPIRVALTGKIASPGTFEVLEALGKEESLKRIKKAIEVIK
ncbi:MAG: glutamate--tRNA ligase [Patescibacteria group bacterium]|nr:glutamate--tRNA ligase [Patescibacteria group bacterium]